MMPTNFGVVPCRDDVPPGMFARLNSHSMFRLLEAPRAEVFRRWSDPVRLARWLEPYGLADPICEMELHPGGTYRIVMQGTDGSEYVLSFEEDGRKTRITLEAPLARVEMCSAILDMPLQGD
nr:SRPBCC domain-containing protein [Pseudomonas sp.]